MTARQLPKIAALLNRVRALTSKRGEKKKLAEYLGTSSQVLNDWLSARRIPNGEVTLSILEWVTEEEGPQKKNRGGASNTTTAKTRSKHNNYEKQKSKQRKNQ